MDDELASKLSDGLGDGLGGLGGLEFSFSGMLAGIIFGLIGWWLFRQGRKHTNLKVVWIGVTMMIYPYFTRGPWIDWVIGVALCALAYHYW